jgi:hypothetical protein
MPGIFRGDEGLRRQARLLAWQFAGSWALGSALMGTVALIYLKATTSPPPPYLPVLHDAGVPSPDLLSAFARLGIFLLVVALFVLLGMLGWRTADACWLAGDGRARVLWTLLVGAGGLLGWSFAAVVTFDVGWSHGVQIALAYTVGGLPFALVAAMLARPWQVNAAAVTASVLLVAAGIALTAGPHVSPNVFRLYADYARSVLAGTTNRLRS